MGILVFLGIAALVAVVCHRWVRPFLLALLISGPVAAAVFQVVARIQLGRLDPFWLIAFFTTTLAGWVVSLAVGLLMRFLPFDPVRNDGATPGVPPPTRANGDPSRANDRPE